MSEFYMQNHGRPGHEMSLQLTGPRDRIIGIGIIPASAFPADDTFCDGYLPNGVGYEVERLSPDDSVWDVWLNLPPDPWLDLLASAEKAKAMSAIWDRMLRKDDNTQALARASHRSVVDVPVAGTCRIRPEPST